MDQQLSAQHVEKAIAHHERGEWEAAAQAYHHALANEPTNVEALHGGSVLALQCGDPATAVELLRRAVKYGANEPDTHMLLGRALKGIGELDAAIESYLRAIELAPDWVDAYINLGIAFRMQNRLGEAVLAYRQALSLDPRSVETHINLANVLQLSGNLDYALDHYDTALNLAPGSTEARRNREHAERALDAQNESGVIPV